MRQRAVDVRHSVGSGERGEGGRHRLDVARGEHAGADLADQRAVVVGDDGHGRAVRDGTPQERDHVEPVVVDVDRVHVAADEAERGHGERGHRGEVGDGAEEVADDVLPRQHAAAVGSVGGGGLVVPLAGARGGERDQQALAAVGQQHVNGVEQPAKFDPNTHGIQSLVVIGQWLRRTTRNKTRIKKRQRAGCVAYLVWGSTRWVTPWTPATAAATTATGRPSAAAGSLRLPASPQR